MAHLKYSISQEICTRFLLCCALLWLYIFPYFPISTRLTSLALWQSNDCPSASKATLMNMDKYFMWIHYERLHNHNNAKHNKTVCIFLGIYCNMWLTTCLFTALRLCHVLFDGRSRVSWDGFTWEPLPYYWCFVQMSCQWCCLNTLKLRQNAILQKKFSNAFFNENGWIFIKTSLKFVPKGPINTIPSMVFR